MTNDCVLALVLLEQAFLNRGPVSFARETGREDLVLLGG